MNRNILMVVAAIVVLAVAGAAYVLWPRHPTPAEPALPDRLADTGVVVPPVVPVPTHTASSAPAAAPEPGSAAAAQPPLPATEAAVTDALVALLGRPAVLRWLHTDAFVDRVVATVDSLPRAHSAPRLWPVLPTDGRFTVDADSRIALGNAERYGPFIRQLESVSAADVATLYRRLAPQLQTAYEALGYPGRRFDARLIEVVDHLLATPVVAPPLTVTLTDVKGPILAERPWVRYEFADPALEARSAGQKILLRVGEVNQRRLMGWLRQFRVELAR